MKKTLLYQLDKERVLATKYKVLTAIQARGVDVFNLGSGVPLESIITILWISLSVEDPTLEKDDVGDMIVEYSNMEEAAGKVKEILESITPFLTGMTLNEMIEKQKEQAIQEITEEPKND